MFAQCGEKSMLAHDHKGYKRVAQDIYRLFYWPSLWKDLRRHCQACSMCQRYCVDLAGPLPKAKGGVEYMLKCVVATRWPEAIPLKSTTAKVIVSKLTKMFSRNGFPGVLVSDNGPKLISRTFKEFCEKNGIHHIRTAVFSPKSNGIVERSHGTFKTMLAKCSDGGGDWRDLLPMTLFFLRMMPCASSGFSPFMLSHGWEPNTPARLL